MKPEISLIIPARNEEKAIAYTLEGLARDLAGHDYEIIIVDDGSKKILSQEIKPAGPVSILRNAERLGVAKSANLGARKAAGEILIFLDAHVAFSKGWVSKLFAHKGLLLNSIVGTAIKPLYGLEEFREKINSPKFEGSSAEKIYFGYQVAGFPEPVIQKNLKKEASVIFQVPYVSACALIVSRELFFKIGGFEDELSGFGSVQDLELCMRAWALGYEVNIISSIVCYHCYYGESSKEDIKPASAHPLRSSKYDHSLENALRVYYLHSSEDLFESFLAHHKKHPEFNVDPETLINEALKKRRLEIEQRRNRSEKWVFERMSCAGVSNYEHVVMEPEESGCRRRFLKKTEKSFEQFLVLLRVKSSLTDCARFRRYCRRAARDPREFERFRKHPDASAMEGERSLDFVKKYYDSLKTLIPDVESIYGIAKANDALGDPRKFRFEDGKEFSASTLRYLKTAGYLKNIFGDVSSMDIVEIGSGYGGQCKVLTDYMGYRNYTMVDLPEVLELAEQYLKRLGVQGVQFQNAIKLKHKIESDLLISDFAFCELARFKQDDYLNCIVRFAKRGFMNFNRFRFARSGYRVEEFAKKIKGSEIVEPDVPVDFSHKILVWGMDKK